MVLDVLIPSELTGKHSSTRGVNGKILFLLPVLKQSQLGSAPRRETQRSVMAGISKRSSVKGGGESMTIQWYPIRPAS
jgi:hypothetical protein